MLWQIHKLYADRVNIAFLKPKKALGWVCLCHFHMQVVLWLYELIQYIWLETFEGVSGKFQMSGSGAMAAGTASVWPIS